MAESKVNISEPKIETRAAQPYVALPVKAPVNSFGPLAVQAIHDMDAWLAEHGIAPSGPLFWRYTVINMDAEAGQMELEVGFPVAQPVAGDGRVVSGTLPAGDYVTTIYTGNVQGPGLYHATGALLEWSEKQGIQYDRHDVPGGDAWAARLEWYLSDPDTEPDEDKWRTELAFKTK